MARQTINTGSAANDGTGDTLRGAATKINANFSELYTLLGGDAAGTGTTTGDTTGEPTTPSDGTKDGTDTGVAGMLVAALSPSRTTSEVLAPDLFKLDNNIPLVGKLTQYTPMAAPQYLLSGISQRYRV